MKLTFFFFFETYFLVEGSETNKSINYTVNEKIISALGKNTAGMKDGKMSHFEVGWSGIQIT